MNKILIVEDEKAILGMIADIIGKYGEIHVAKNPKEATKLISKNNFDLIITDYYLGNATGFDVVKAATQYLGHIPVILISAYPTVDMLSEGIEMKVLSFLRKPINFDQLTLKVESILNVEHKFSFGDRSIFLKNSSLSVGLDGEEIQLTEIQFKLFKMLIENLNKVCTREDIISCVWGSKFLNSDNVLDTHLMLLKKRLPLVRDHLKTVPRVGYKLTTELN